MKNNLIEYRRDIYHNHCGGFTLIELVIVITIMAIGTAYVAPRILSVTDFFSANTNKGTNLIQGMIQEARSQAIVKHKTYYIRFDLDHRIIGIYPRAESSQEFEYEKKAEIPKGVDITGVKRPNEPTKDQGTIDLRVTPEGVVEKGAIYVTGGSNTFTLVVKPFSGGFREYEGYKEVV